MHVLNSTLSGNYGFAGGGIFAVDATLSFQNSVLSGNRSFASSDEVSTNGGTTVETTNGNLFGHGGRTSSQAFNTFTPDVGDIIASSDSANIALTQILDPSLADNGGPTLTHALVANSPAINAGDPAACAINNITADQRGEFRDALCDIGAFEFIDDLCFVVMSNTDKTMILCL